METLPINLTETVSAVLGLLVAFIPVVGILVRLAAKPVVEALLATRGEGARPADLDALKMRIEALEHEVKELSGPGQRSLPAPVPLRP
jgi:hypothetical protein